MPTSADFQTWVAAYQNTAEHNDALHAALTEATWKDAVLAEHRRHVEAHQLGFGDPAFHAMWRGLMLAAAMRFGRVRALEIGVFKGQVISLWALLAKTLALPIQIAAISPLAGSVAPRPGFWSALRYRVDRRFREHIDNGNFYADDDYEAAIRGLFERFGLDFSAVALHRGYSTDPLLRARLGEERFEVVYVDGDHSYEGARQDFLTYGPKVVPGGWLIADDASCDLPGSRFWKGHPAVSRAVTVLPELGFRNVLNVGHNRIYQRV